MSSEADAKKICDKIKSIMNNWTPYNSQMRPEESKLEPWHFKLTLYCEPCKHKFPVFYKAGQNWCARTTCPKCHKGPLLMADAANYMDLHNYNAWQGIGSATKRILRKVKHDGFRHVIDDQKFVVGKMLLDDFTALYPDKPAPKIREFRKPSKGGPVKHLTNKMTASEQAAYDAQCVHDFPESEGWRELRVTSQTPDRWFYKDSVKPWTLVGTEYKLIPDSLREDTQRPTLEMFKNAGHQIYVYTIWKDGYVRA